MPSGPGKYDDLATLVRLRAKARGVVLIVLEGERGNGFEVHADADGQARLPAMLRHLADEIERSRGPS